MKDLFGILISFAIALSGASAHAQTYPAKSITIVVPFGPGSGTDLVPELPTLDESGVKDFDMDSWAGLFAPGKTPRPIVQRLRKIIDDPDVKAKIAITGFEAFSSSTEELDTFVKEPLVKWSRMIKEAGIQPQ